MKNIAYYLDIFRKLGISYKTNITDLNIDFITYDSNKATYNTLFICKGSRFKEKYLIDAIKSGATCYISQKKYNIDIPYIIVDDIRLATAVLAKYYYGCACDKLKIIGITGTKGKTTTAYMLKSILGDKAGVLSSIICFDGKQETLSTLTTPEPLELHEYFYKAVNNGMEYMIMEVSSQALKYHRVAYLNFYISAFLNIGSDHIGAGEHSDFLDYLSSKLKIFDMSEKSIVCSVNDEHIIQSCKSGITFGLKSGDTYCADNIIKKDNGLNFTVGHNEYFINMVGEFNVSNALAAISICEILGIDNKNIKAGLEKTYIPGRMEIFKGKKADIIVDYAHNKLSFETAIKSLKKDYKEVITVFGCPGNKSSARRQDLAVATSLLSDKIILTEDDPAREEFYKICSEIGEHMTKDYFVMQAREDAINFAYDIARKGAAIFVAGKGREMFMKRGDERQPYTGDHNIAENIIKNEDIN